MSEIDTVSRTEVLDFVLGHMQSAQNDSGLLRSIPQISFVEGLGTGGTYELCGDVVYTVGMDYMDEQVSIDIAAPLVMEAVHESRHNTQITDFFFNGGHDLMFKDWLSDRAGAIFYNAGEHYDLHEWDAYHEGMIGSRDILSDWFGKEAADEKLLSMMMALAEHTDTVYFTADKKYDYKSLDAYLSDMESFGESLYHTREPVNAKTLYKGSSKVANYEYRVKDIREDMWQSYLSYALPEKQILAKQFMQTRDAFEQRTILAGFACVMDRSLERLFPKLHDLDFRVEVRRGPFGLSVLETQSDDFSAYNFSKAHKSVVWMSDTFLDSREGLLEYMDNNTSLDDTMRVELGSEGKISVRDISEIKTNDFWQEVKQVYEQEF